MNQNLIILLVLATATPSYSMDDFLRKLTGQQVLEYIRTEHSEREAPIKILNQTGQSIILQATYDCRTRIMYSALLCFGRCCSFGSFPAITESEDTHVLFNNGQTIELAPIQPNIAKSKVRLKSLKARFAHGPGDWVAQRIPSESKADEFKLYQGLVEVIVGEGVHTLTQQDGTILLQ